MRQFIWKDTALRVLPPHPCVHRLLFIAGNNTGGSSPDSLTWKINGMAELSLAFPNSECQKYLGEELVKF